MISCIKHVLTIVMGNQNLNLREVLLYFFNLLKQAQLCCIDFFLKQPFRLIRAHVNYSSGFCRCLRKSRLIYFICIILLHPYFLNQVFLCV